MDFAFKLKSVVLTIHVAGYPIEASAHSHPICAENIISVLRERKPNIAKYEVLELHQVRIRLND